MNDLNDPDYVMTLLDRAVEERGADYVYQEHFGSECRYTIDGQPACIAGLVYSYTGDVTVLEDTQMYNSIFNAFQGEYSFDSSAAKIIQIAQDSQDRGRSWGRSVENARYTYSRIKEKQSV